jgi:vacuolar-type H+-ATPase subunit I/STV1
MELANNILLILHFVGLAALLSGFFYQLKDWGKGMKVNAGILHGAWLQLITGLGMVGLIQAMHGTEQVNNLVMAVKTVILTVIFFVAYSFNKKEKTPTWVVPAIAGLTTINIALAVLGPIMIPA